MGNKSSPFCTFLQDRVCVAMKAPVGAFKRQSGLAQARWRGIAPTSSVGFAIKGIMDCAARQDGLFYCSKAVMVGLIFNTRQETISVSHIVMFAEKTYNAFEPVGHTKRGKERES